MYQLVHQHILSIHCVFTEKVCTVLYCTVGYLCAFSQSVSQSGITNTLDDDNDEVVVDDDDDDDDY